MWEGGGRGCWSTRGQVSWSHASQFTMIDRCMQSVIHSLRTVTEEARFSGNYNLMLAHWDFTNYSLQQCSIYKCRHAGMCCSRIGCVELCCSMQWTSMFGSLSWIKVRGT